MKAPKIVRDLAALITTSRRETDLDKLTLALVEARQQIEVAGRDREAAEAAYRDGLLDATPAELERLQAAQGRAKIDLDRAEALVAALTTRIATVREAEARAARQEIFLDATKQCEAIRSRLPAEYAHHAGAIRHLLRDLAQAEAARERAAKEAPDFPAIPSPEVELRSLNGLPEEIVTTETVELWVIDGRTDPVPADRQGDVRRYDERPDRGTLSMPGSTHHAAPTSGVALTCTLRQFTRTRYRESMVGRDDGSLLRSVALPSFTGDVPCFVTASPYRDHNGALIELSADLTPPAPRHRPILERLTLVPVDQPPAREPIRPFAKSEPTPHRTPSAGAIRAEHTPSRVMASGGAR